MNTQQSPTSQSTPTNNRCFLIGREDETPAVPAVAFGEGASSRRPANPVATPLRFLAVAALLILGLLIPSPHTKAGELAADFTEPVLFDSALYSAYLSSSVESLADLINVYESRQYSILPIVMPDPAFIHLEEGGLLPFEPANFPKRFVRRLIPVLDQGSTVYPVTVLEIPDSGARQILNAAGDVIAEIDAPKDYDPRWYVQLRFPDLSKLDAETTAWYVALYDPSRIMVRFRLIDGDELINKVMAESLAAQQLLSSSALTFSPLSLNYPASGLAFESLSVQTNGSVDVSMSWPSGTLATEGLDIFSCTNLMEQQWSILLTTNVNNAAGSFAFNAPSAGTGGMCFLDAW